MYSSFWKIFIYDYALDLQIVQNCSYIGERIPRDCHRSLTIHFSTYFAVKYSRYRRGWLTSSRLLATRSNVISKHLRWMRVDWITVTFFLHFPALPRRFASRISNNIRASFEWHWREFPIAVSSIKLILFLALFGIFLLLFRVFMNLASTYEIKMYDVREKYEPWIRSNIIFLVIFLF